jgi:membrane-associated phospholipid phosphatase
MMLQVIARIISVVFHPLAVIMAFAMVYITTIYDNEMALLVMSLFGYIAVLPIVIYNSVQLLRGKISNFDLSNQHERNKSYPLLLLILILLVVSAIYTNVPTALVLNLGIFGLMLVVFYFFRNFLKISLHASTSFFLTALIIFDFGTIGLYAAIISMLVAFSRIVLKRHTKMEVVIGGVSGLLLGFFSCIIR